MRCNPARAVMTAALSLVLTVGCAATPQPATDLQAGPAGEEPFELAALRLPTPADPAHRGYLGVSPGETFALSEIKARILIIEVFSMYCPHCQKEAPIVNRLFQQIQADPQLKAHIKIIGIGVGNTPYEVSFFRKTYAVPFPLFADRSRVLSTRLEVRQTPTFIGWGYHAGGRVRPFLFAPGPIGDVERFLERTLRDAGVDLSDG
jgi:peroxiredoxin